MTADELLLELRTALSGKKPDSDLVRKRVAMVVNRPGAAELLLEVLETGGAFETQQAAFGLGFARSDLIRRKLRNMAREAEGDRRLACLAALTPDELTEFLSAEGEGARKTLLESASLIALNRPAEFVDLVCEGAVAVDTSAVQEIETMRRNYGIGAASLYVPLLQRPLTDAAVAAVAGNLGSARGAEVKELLQKLMTRAKDDALVRNLRREQMRQASLTVAGAGAPARAGVAVLRPLQADDHAWLELYEQLPTGWTVQTSVCWSPREAPEFMSTPLEGEAQAYADGTMDGTTDARLSLGQAKGLLEAFTEARRSGIEPVLDRLSDVPTEDAPAPVIGSILSESDAERLITAPMWKAWQPFASLTGDDTPDASALVAKLYEKRAGAAALASGFQHMSVVLHLRGDPAADSVAAEALWVAEEARPSALALALARAELERRKSSG